jgi:rapamycin-insensitive companion of mTOR
VLRNSPPTPPAAHHSVSTTTRCFPQPRRKPKHLSCFAHGDEPVLSLIQHTCTRRTQIEYATACPPASNESLPRRAPHNFRIPIGACLHWSDDRCLGIVPIGGNSVGPTLTMLSASATPTQKAFTPQPSSSAVNSLNPRSSFERDGGTSLQPPGLVPPTNGARNLSASAVSFAPRGSSLNPSIAPGSFSSELRSQMIPSRAQSRADVYSMEKVDEDDDTGLEQTLSALREQLNREMKIKEGSENMLEALNTKKAKQSKDQRARVEAELNASNARIKELRQRISETQRTRAMPTTPTRTRTAETLFQANGLRSPPSVSRSGAGSDMEEPTESPTLALTELLQALEMEGMAPEYYVSRANGLVDLFKRHPTLKYDLVWSVFGLRMQVMLLSESREVVAAGYRMTRYAISDVSSLKKIRSLNTDYLVVT